MSTAAARVASIAARWITIEEAGKALTMKPEAVRRLILAGDIYGVKVGKEWRIDINTIEALLESKRAAAKVAFSNLKK
jgi:excisionase family DNA binding protein